MRASVITPAYPGRWKKGQNDGNPCAYSEKPTSCRKFLGFPIYYRDFLYYFIFCYIFLGFCGGNQAGATDSGSGFATLALETSPGQPGNRATGQRATDSGSGFATLALDTPG